MSTNRFVFLADSISQATQYIGNALWHCCVVIDRPGLDAANDLFVSSRQRYSPPHATRFLCHSLDALLRGDDGLILSVLRWLRGLGLKRRNDIRNLPVENNHT